jgi:hypothetical protein
MQPPPERLLDQVRDAIRLKHYAYRAEKKLRAVDSLLHPVS